ncbi:MAG: CCA tRNA nucleotidyltransferase [Pseudomonadota bacterium]
MTEPARPLTASEKPFFSWMDEPRLSAIIDALEGARPDAVRFVGGCVRDSLLGAWADKSQPTGLTGKTDIDAATTLTPDQLMDLLGKAGIKTIPTGLDHGTVTAVHQGRVVEITTLRRDVATDGRRATIAYTDDWHADAARRDFTINALYVTPAGVLHDEAGGLDDLRAGRVVFIGDAKTRIAEDYLRILRFIRFSARFAGTFDGTGLLAITAMVAGLKTLSAERVAAELMKILALPRALMATETMAQAGILNAIWPTPARLDMARRLDAVAPAATNLAWLTALYPDDYGPLARRLRLSNKEQAKMLAMVTAAKALTDTAAPALVDERRARQVIYRHGPDVWLDALALYAVLTGQGASAIAPLRDFAAHWTAPNFPIKGGDLIKRGLKPGPLVSRALTTIEERWIAEDFPGISALEVLVEAVLTPLLDQPAP